MSFQTYTRPRRAAVSPAVKSVGPVTRVIRGLRPNEMPSWEIREAEMRRQEAADLAALRRRVAKAVTVATDFLDATEADCDVEAEYHTTERAPDGSLYTQGRTSDDEPSLCGIGGHVAFGHYFELPMTGSGCGENPWDLEGEDEHGSDCDKGEDSLGSLGGTAAAIGHSQLNWSGGEPGDVEAVNEDGGDIQDEPHDGDERELDPAEDGIADSDGLAEQFVGTRYVFAGAL